MPLNKGLKNQESERISNILKKLNELIYIPDFDKDEIENQLKFLGLNLETLLNFSSENLVSHLDKFHFDWENAEQFADLLVIFSDKLLEEKSNLKEKALAVYNYIQSESKTFSFEIFNKITSVKATV
ncbi:hypothetical protein J2X31_003068 [Flavobacterium arsenatis]|uniref:Uncharacterized protein n=1 Tax=Flavobacterium arsenatis TaxID=1484332 RepID=A0ABU1TT73_9FLAO|nr:hypothetical protein [Flavobacterium arsenatis]MDR6969042.1 hypothetical protein [Flavobacterium arsenatis]